MISDPSSQQNTYTGPVIHLDNVHKVYQMGTTEVRALDGVTQKFERGSFWAIMGSSGSGKSTMLNLLGCLDRPSLGNYTLAGRDVSTLSDDEMSDIRLRYLGFVFQSFHLIPQNTVRENIELPLYYQGWDPLKSKARASELAERVGLADRLDHKPQELSGGQRQRVAIARSLANDPEVLLADEPTGNLDSSTGDQIMDILCELNESGKTIIMVTHEPEIANNAMYRMHMRDGRIDRID